MKRAGESAGGKKTDGCSKLNLLTRATKTEIIKGGVPLQQLLPEGATASFIPEAAGMKPSVGAHRLCLTLLQGEPHPHYKTEKLCGGSHHYLLAS